jgi:hypothetical protein
VDGYDPARNLVSARGCGGFCRGGETMGGATNWASLDDVWRVADPAALPPFEVCASTYVDDARHLESWAASSPVWP